MKSLSFPKGVCRQPFTQMKPQSPGASLSQSNLQSWMQFCLSFQKMVLIVNLEFIWAFTRGLPSLPTRLPIYPFTQRPPEFTRQHCLCCRFQDGAATANNPAAIALQEALLLWPGLPIDCLVSLGSGALPPAPREKSMSR